MVTKKQEKSPRYYEAVGRRKNAVARIRLYSRTGDFVVNEKAIKLYFSTARQRRDATAPISELKLEKVSFTAKVKGGGLSGQAQAIQHGIARALLLLNPVFKKRLRKLGYLTRDSRMVERKKFGLKKARRAPQWAKR